MRNFIKSKLRNFLLEKIGEELITSINVNIPFNKLVLDKLNLEWAIENIRDKKPSRSKDKPMQVAMSYGGKYYLLDGYHRFVEAVMAGKTSTKGVLLNTSYDELKKHNKISVGCAGGSGDEYCSNFKNLGSIEMIKNEFRQINEQMIDGQDMTPEMQTACNKMTINSYEEALNLTNEAIKHLDDETKKKIMKKIITPLENLKHEQSIIEFEKGKYHMSGDSLPDEADTYWHQIQTIICELKENLN